MYSRTTNIFPTLKQEKDIQTIRRSRSARQGDGNIIWKSLWNLKIPNASKMFKRRACNDILSTKMNLL